MATLAPAREQSTATILLRLVRHIERAGGGTLSVALEDGEWGVSVGLETPDSPMSTRVGCGIGTLRHAVEDAAHDCHLLAKEARLEGR